MYDKNDFPLIIIREKSELARFGLQADKFRRYGSGEWHGPCPHCPGSSDRCIISNGFVRCRQNVHLWTKRQNRPTYGVPLAWLDENYQLPSPAEMERIMRAQEEQRAREEEERLDKILQLSESRIWDRYHVNLLKRPDRLEELEQDGISAEAVAHFHIGLNTHAAWWDDANEKHICEAFTFPIFRKMEIGGVTQVYCLNVRQRMLDPLLAKKDKYRPYQKGLGQSYFLANIKGAQWGVIVEGEKKAIVLWQHQIPAMALFGVEFFHPDWKQEVQTRWPAGHFVIFDHEDPDAPDDRGKAKRIWERCQRTAEASGGIPVQLPWMGKPDDILVQGIASAEDILRVLEEARTNQTIIKNGVRIR